MYITYLRLIDIIKFEVFTWLVSRWFNWFNLPIKL